MKPISTFPASSGLFLAACAAVAAAEDLGRRHGAGFDRVYARAQVTDRQRAVQLHEGVVSAGQNAAVKTCARQTPPQLLEHLEHAQRLVADLPAVHGGQIGTR